MKKSLKDLKNRLEPIGEKIGYKTIRYGYKGIPYAITYLKNRDKIKQLYNIVEDEESKKVIKAVIKANITRSARLFISKVFNENEIIRKEMQGEMIIYHPNHYFDPEIVVLSDNEVFVDAGGFIGDTTLNFMEKMQGKFKKIHIFEASPHMYKMLVANMKDHNVDFDKVILHEKGLYSSKTEAFFQEEESAAGSKISSKGNVNVQLVAMDDYLSPVENDEISFVKMDIEGAEMDALQGMQEMIKKNKPKLAISVYHLKDDLWNIPFYIKTLNSDYRLYIRHYAIGLNETVCYAMPK